MPANRKLLILDIDNTLLNTVILRDLAEGELQRIREALLRALPGSACIKDEPRIVVVPRPHLVEFTEYLNGVKGILDVGIYSSATASYIRKVLSAVFPWCIGNARFIWDITYCYELDGILKKDLSKISQSMGYRLENIRMLDDSEVILQRKLRIEISPFENAHVSKTKKDRELLRVIDDLERFVSYES